MNYPPHPVQFSRRTPVFGRALVATSHYLASKAGISVMERGGNAVDAAIATAAMLTLVEPTGCGLGSDAFAIIHDGKQLHGLNSSGPSPQGAHRDFYRKLGGIPERGWHAVTVPGAVAGWASLSKEFGKLAFEELFDEVVDQAERGFHVTPVVAHLWHRDAQILRSQPGFEEMFLRQGKAPVPGSLFQQQGMAESFRLIARSGGRDFYEGYLAEQIIRSAKHHDALMNEHDLAGMSPEWVPVISQEFGQAQLHELPPNGQGIAASMALGILRHTDFDHYGPRDARRLHLTIEAMKLAFADLQTHVADPRHMKIGHQQMLDDQYLAERAALINPYQASHFGAGAPPPGGTVYLCAADKNGLMVSFIQSNYMGMGSGVCIPGTGIHLQNRGANFVMDEEHPNCVAGGKRPFHTIIPGFVTGHDGGRMATGVMGAFMQAQGHVQMVINTQIDGMDLQTAIDYPRWRYIEGKKIELEAGFDLLLADELIRMGHEVQTMAASQNGGFGGAQLIATLPSQDGYVGGSDPRKDGQVMMMG